MQSRSEQKKHSKDSIVFCAVYVLGGSNISKPCDGCGTPSHPPSFVPPFVMPHPVPREFLLNNWPSPKSQSSTYDKTIPNVDEMPKIKIKTMPNLYFIVPILENNFKSMDESLEIYSIYTNSISYSILLRNVFENLTINSMIIVCTRFILRKKRGECDKRLQTIITQRSWKSEPEVYSVRFFSFVFLQINDLVSVLITFVKSSF